MRQAGFRIRYNGGTLHTVKSVVRAIPNSDGNSRTASGNSRRTTELIRLGEDYRLDCIEGAAIADPEIGSNPGNLLTAMHSGSSATCNSHKI
jgi:hypothetical protein